MSLQTAMNNVDNAELETRRTARLRAVAANAVLEAMSTHQRTIVTDNDAALIEVIFQTLRKVVPDAKAPTLSAPGEIESSVKTLIDTLNGEGVQ